MSTLIDGASILAPKDSEAVVIGEKSGTVIVRKSEALPIASAELTASTTTLANTDSETISITSSNPNTPNSQSSDIIITFGEPSIISSSAGNDIIKVNPKTETAITVDGNDGNDIIAVQAGTAHVLRGGIGNDTLVLSKLESNSSYVIDQTTAGATDRDILNLANYNSKDFDFAYDDSSNLILTNTKLDAEITIQG